MAAQDIQGSHSGYGCPEFSNQWMGRWATGSVHYVGGRTLPTVICSHIGSHHLLALSLSLMSLWGHPPETSRCPFFIWPHADFMLVPATGRVLFANGAGLLWNAFLSLVNSSSNQQQQEERQDKGGLSQSKAVPRSR